MLNYGNRRSKIYYLLIEGKPFPDNPESKEVTGAYINCFVKAEGRPQAKAKAAEYINSEGWDVINIEEIRVVRREGYLDIPESLEGYDSAEEYGAGAIFYRW